MFRGREAALGLPTSLCTRVRAASWGDAQQRGGPCSFLHPHSSTTAPQAAATTVTSATACFLPPSPALRIHAELQMPPDSLSAVNLWQGGVPYHSPGTDCLPAPAVQPFGMLLGRDAAHGRASPCHGSGAQMGNSLRCGAPAPPQKKNLAKKNPKKFMPPVFDVFSARIGCTAGSGHP